MQELKFNDNVTLRYQYSPVIGSGNAFVPARYYTEVWLGKYKLGTYNGKLDEADIKDRVAEEINVSQEKQYGIQYPKQRKDLRPKRRGAY